MRVSSLAVVVVLALLVPGSAVGQDSDWVVEVEDPLGDVTISPDDSEDYAYMDLTKVRVWVEDEDLVVLWEVAEEPPADFGENPAPTFSLFISRDGDKQVESFLTVWGGVDSDVALTHMPSVASMDFIALEPAEVFGRQVTARAPLAALGTPSDLRFFARQTAMQVPDWFADEGDIDWESIDVESMDDTDVDDFVEPLGIGDDPIRGWHDRVPDRQKEWLSLAPAKPSANEPAAVETPNLANGPSLDVLVMEQLPKVDFLAVREHLNGIKRAFRAYLDERPVVGWMVERDSVLEVAADLLTDVPLPGMWEFRFEDCKWELRSGTKHWSAEKVFAKRLRAKAALQRSSCVGAYGDLYRAFAYTGDEVLSDLMALFAKATASTLGPEARRNYLYALGDVPFNVEIGFPSLVPDFVYED